MRKQTIIEGAAQSAPIHHIAQSGQPWAVLTVDCGAWVRVILFGDVAQRGALPWLQRGAPVRISGRLSVRVTENVRTGKTQAGLEMIADQVEPVAQTVATVP